MIKYMLILFSSLVISSKSFSQVKAKQFQYMPGVNKKIITGKVTSIFYTNRWNKDFKWLEIGKGDTIIHVWPKDSETFKVGQVVSLKGIKELNQNLGNRVKQVSVVVAEN